MDYVPPPSSLSKARSPYIKSLGSQRPLTTMAGHSSFGRQPSLFMSSPSFGFGTVPQRGRTPKSLVPGPGKYEHGRSMGKVPASHHMSQPEYSMRDRHLYGAIVNTSISPGPGNYFSVPKPVIRSIYKGPSTAHHGHGFGNRLPSATTPAATRGHRTKGGARTMATSQSAPTLPRRGAKQAR